MKRWISTLGAVALSVLYVEAPTAYGFCGFYVAKADARLYNKASQVVLVRHDDKTVLTMANDFRGDPREFAVVIPVPTFIQRDQIHITDKALINHLDTYSAPRLVEYFDENPCYRRVLEKAQVDASLPASAGRRDRAEALGVAIEAEYTVGEYDIVILSAEQSEGLQTWLVENGYRLPPGASRVLASYIRQNMRFFVAKVNLEEQSRLGYSYLRPIQIAYESPKFMLPIRLGTVNGDGPQDLLVYALTRNGRVETTNYRTVKLPTNVELPLFVKEEFGDFYRAMFTEQVSKQNMRTVFLEYAWDMSWCDPCAADPLSRDQLRELGVFWIGGNTPGRVSGPAVDVFVTRLHVRYDGEHFPDDLRFQETGDRSNFQGRYILRHPYEGPIQCDSAKFYRRELRDRRERQARNLASLTGWDIGEIREKMRLEAPEPESWWQRLWKR